MKNKLIVVLSGEIGVGKSTLSKFLNSKFNFKIIKTRDALVHFIGKNRYKPKPNEDERAFYQRVGETLDKNTDGRWIIEYFQKYINENDRIIVDSIRILKQIEALRISYGYQNVIHIHLYASDIELERRYFSRNGIEINDLSENQKYKQYKSNLTEIGVKKLITEADLILDCEKTDPEDNIVRIASFLQILPSIHVANVDVIIGAQFGSEGKGQIAAYLAPEYDYLVRVGGANAGHKVYETGKPDVFRIIPSGARRAPNSIIVIGPGAVINVDVLLEEIRNFNIQPERLFIDENATIVSEKDKILEGKIDKIGSTKQGIGAATANNLFKSRLNESRKHKASECLKLKCYIRSTHAILEEAYSQNKKILLEGTQGTMLSLHHGIYPYVTSRDTTVSGCLADAGISPLRIRKIIMVTRSYPIRVKSPNDGTSGPFSRVGQDSEITLQEISKKSGIPLSELENTEKTSVSHKLRRIANFNWAMFREACELNSPTDIALTFTDYISKTNKEARRYDQLTPDTTKFIDEIERCAGVQVSLIATDFSYRAIIDRRNWR